MRLSKSVCYEDLKRKIGLRQANNMRRIWKSSDPQTCTWILFARLCSYERVSFFLRSSLRIFSSLVNSEEQIREIERLKDFHLEEKAYWARRKAGNHEGMNIADCGCDCMGCHYERCVDCSACKNICMDCRVPTGLILRRRTLPSSSWKSQTHFRCNEKETQGISLIRKESTLLRRRQSPVKDNSPLESRHRVSLS